MDYELTHRGSTCELLCGDVVDKLREIPAESVQMIATSSPYWGLRDYGVSGQLGAEKIHDCMGWTRGENCGECFICHMRLVANELYRVLSPDGTLWWNIGDCYAGSSGSGGKTKKQVTNKASFHNGKTRANSIGAKNLVGIPWRLAFALQSDGWILRSDIIWHKPNVFPGSYEDRVTTAKEYIFMLSKSKKYFFDFASIEEPRVSKNNTCGPNSRANVDRVPRKNRKQDMIGRGDYVGFNDRWRENETTNRRKRDVWTVAVKPFRDAHFAVFPPDLVRPMILAGSKPGDTVLDPFCGSGTTLLVALDLGRSAIGIDLNEEYIDMARERIKKELTQ